MSEVLLTGASGQLGRVVAPALAVAGHGVRALSREGRADDGPVRWVRGDLATGAGLAEAVAGADAVVHLASAPYRRGYTRQVDVEGTYRLAAAARAAGVGHLVYVSIVGVDAVPWGYYRVKLAAEEAVRTSGVGWTVLRATQFHTFPDQIFAATARLGALVVDPGIRVQTVDLDDVAARLAEIVAAGPSGQVLELCGPEVFDMGEIARQWLHARGLRRPVVRMRVPGRLGRAFRADSLVTDAVPRGAGTWGEYLQRTAMRRSRA
ncbi:SDR family oxidoreductase [Georgenia ruanii]|uniref:NAD(P)H-binding protein n=1 Tax=Georgenia ruanii TaxID=348442 RepID=A0A7J9V0C9_9MICO|nr:NAD(P)H-binding protein [Georgenia ruanii]MPV90339.1 NAD(P)H-binding protein [Georgenia ruanii]